jgi:uncharacterized protein
MEPKKQPTQQQPKPSQPQRQKQQQGAEPGIIDAFDFARQGDVLTGRTPFGCFPRFTEGMPPQVPASPHETDAANLGLVCWTVQGACNAQGEHTLHLQAQANPVLVCQRCMEPFVYALNVQLTWQLVHSAAELDSDVDVGVENPDLEKVVGSRRFNLLMQIEDELVLNLPYVPKHTVCPHGGVKGEGKPSEGKPVQSNTGSQSLDSTGPITPQASPRVFPFLGLEKLKTVSKLKK